MYLIYDRHINLSMYLKNEIFLILKIEKNTIIIRWIQNFQTVLLFIHKKLIDSNLFEGFEIWVWQFCFVVLFIN
jgi:hypothetical protein